MARPVAGLIGRLFAWSVPGKLGRLNSGRNPRRTAITAAALMVGIALITGINTVLVVGQAEPHQGRRRQANVDLIISGDRPAAAWPTFDPAVLDQTAALPGVPGRQRPLRGRRAGQRRPHVRRGVLQRRPRSPGMFSLTATAGSTSRPSRTVRSSWTRRPRRRAPDPRQPGHGAAGPGRAAHLTVSGIYAKSDLISGFVLPLSAAKNFTPAAADDRLHPGRSRAPRSPAIKSAGGHVCSRTAPR